MDFPEGDAAGEQLVRRLEKALVSQLRVLRVLLTHLCGRNDDLLEFWDRKSTGSLLREMRYLMLDVGHGALFCTQFRQASAQIQWQLLTRSVALCVRLHVGAFSSWCFTRRWWLTGSSVSP